MKPISTDGRVAEPAETPAACAPDSNRGESAQVSGNTASCTCQAMQDLKRQNASLKEQLTTALDRIVELQIHSQVPNLPPEQHPRLPNDEEDEN